MQCWQYKTLTYAWDAERQDLAWGDRKEIPADTVDKRLNALGRGWELISIEKMSDVSHVTASFYLKRIEEDRVHLVVTSELLDRLPDYLS